MSAGKVVTIAAIGVIALAGCTDPRYQAGGDRERTRTGALTGAAIGGLIGGIEETGSDRIRQAAIGAAIGGAIGGLIGNNLDKQAEELRQDLDSDIGVINTGSELIVRMPQDILFAVDSAVVQPALRSDLFALADSLRRYPDTVVEIVGHTDSTGSAAYNQNLSERRAFAVADILRGAGVSSSRLRTFGAGESQPLTTNLTPEGRQQNRRVDITIRPTG